MERKFMQTAIDAARKGVRQGQSPFGSAITKGNKLVTVAHNTVFAHGDSTNHAEINAIRLACKKLKTHDLKGCAIYTTCEPCPMCFSAIHWADLDECVYGATIRDAQECGFRELTIPAKTMKRLGKAKLKIARFMAEECRQMMREWMERKDRKTY